MYDVNVVNEVKGESRISITSGVLPPTVLATRALQPIPQREIPPQSCKCKHVQVRVVYVFGFFFKLVELSMW